MGFKMKQNMFVILLSIFVVFIIGVFVGSAWKGAGSSSVDRMIKQSELDAESFLIEQELFESFDIDCGLAETRLADLSDGLWKLGKVLAVDNAVKNLGEDNFNFLKRKFHLMQVRTYLLYKEFLSKCDTDQNVILYYYGSNQDSVGQGSILDSLVQEFGLKVFAVEFGYSDDLLFLEQYYDISQTPALIINYDHKLEGLSTREDILPYVV